MVKSSYIHLAGGARSVGKHSNMRQQLLKQEDIPADLFNHSSCRGVAGQQVRFHTAASVMKMDRRLYKNLLI